MFVRSNEVSVVTNIIIDTKIIAREYRKEQKNRKHFLPRTIQTI